jgi:hypothetical protein
MVPLLTKPPTATPLGPVKLPTLVETVLPVSLLSSGELKPVEIDVVVPPFVAEAQETVLPAGPL